MRRCTSGTGTSGSGRIGRPSIIIRIPTLHANSRARIPGSSYSSSTCSGSSISRSKGRRGAPGIAACASACTTTWLWPQTVAGPTSGLTGPITSTAAASGRRPTGSRPTGRTGLSRRPTRSATSENGYELFADSIRKNAKHGGALRIDHVMRFFRLFWIPDGLTAEAGHLRQGLFRGLAAHSGARERPQPVHGDRRGSRDGGALHPRRPETVRGLELPAAVLRKDRPEPVQDDPPNTPRRRWSRRPPTICRRSPASGPAPTSRRGGRPA